MSAFQVEDNCIKLLAVWAVYSQCDQDDLGEINKIAKLMWGANSMSLQARYGEGCVGKIPKVTKADLKRARACSAVVVIKQAHCLDYQSCEHDDWYTSEAYKHMRDAIDHATTRLDGYDDAPWGNVDL